MTSEQRRIGIAWLAMLLAFFLLVYLLRSMLLPFAAGLAIAYFLAPLVDRLERAHLPRGAAAALVLLSFLLLIVVIAMLVWPLLELQISELVRRVPGLVAQAQQRIEGLVQSTQEQLSPEIVARLQEMLGASAKSALGWVVQLAQGLITSGRAVVNVLWLIFVTPIVAFFLLRDWDRIVRALDGWLPRDHAATIREQARLVDATLAGFVHGQVLVSLSLAVYYAVALTIFQLDFALVIGLLVGVLSFIPFIGVTICFALTTGLALLQFGTNLVSLGIVLTFLFGQAIESNFLSPKLVGERINLHPVWIIFALLAFGTLFGIVGVLIALPAAAVVGVLVRFALGRYLTSSLYDPTNLPHGDRR